MTKWYKACVAEERDKLRNINAMLLEMLTVLLAACDAQSFAGGVTSEVLTAMEETRIIIAKATGGEDDR